MASPAETPVAVSARSTSSCGRRGRVGRDRRGGGGEAGGGGGGGGGRGGGPPLAASTASASGIRGQVPRMRMLEGHLLQVLLGIDSAVSRHLVPSSLAVQLPGERVIREAGAEDVVKA